MCAGAGEGLPFLLTSLLCIAYGKSWETVSRMPSIAVPSGLPGPLYNCCAVKSLPCEAVLETPAVFWVWELFFKILKPFKIEGASCCLCPLQLDMRKETSPSLQAYTWGIPGITHPSCLCRCLEDHALGLQWRLTASFLVRFLSPMADKCGTESKSTSPWMRETW